LFRSKISVNRPASPRVFSAIKERDSADPFVPAGTM